ncbi:MAG: hypothetical protein AAF146_18690, partial [Bacteroidota bacterium]
PSYPITYELRLDIADGKTVDNLVFQDVLPPSLQYVGLVGSGISGSGATSGCTFTTLPSTSTPGGNIALSCTDATGTTGTSDVVVQYQAYVIDILDHTICDTELYENNASFTTTTQVGTLTDREEDLARHITLTKGMSPGTANPGQTVTTTLNFYVTDYDTATALVMTDIVPDGLNLNPASIALTVGGAPVALTNGVNLTVTTDDPGLGQYTIVVDVVDAFGGNLNGPVQGVLTYTGVVDQTYDLTGDPVLAADSFGDSGNITYDLINGATACTDASSAGIQISPVNIAKSILAPATGPYVPGDIITYRLEMDIPSGDANGIIFEDFLPLPIHLISDFTPAIGSNIRAVTGAGYLGVSPSGASTNVATNSVIINFPDINNTTASRIGVDIDVVVSGEPFADALFHSNILQAQSQNTPAATATGTDLTLIQVFAPDLEMTKGILSTDNPNSTVAPSGTPVDGNATDADAGDVLTYVITVENTGGADAFDLTLRDTRPPNLDNCTLSSVAFADGTVLSSPANYTGDLFTTPLVIDNANPLQEDDGVAGNGQDELLLTYTCTCGIGVEPDETLQNTASVEYAAQPGFSKFPTLTDDATVTIAGPSISKSLLGIAPNFSGAADSVQIGDVVTYQIEVTIPEGTSVDSRLQDAITPNPPGMEFVQMTAVVADPALSTTVAGGFSSFVGTGIAGASSFNLDLGDITNSNTDDNTAETITFTYTALVTNISNNAENRRIRNRGRWVYDGTTINSGRPSVYVAEADVNVTKGVIFSDNPTANATISPVATPPDGNITQSRAQDSVTFVITIENTGSGSALDVEVTDPDIAGLNGHRIITVVDQIGGAVAYTGDPFAGTMVLQDSIPPNGEVVITYRCAIDPDVDLGEILTNTATASWDPPAGSTVRSSDTDDATVEIVPPVSNKTISSIAPNYSGNLTEVHVGEIISYTATIEVAQGELFNAQIIDSLDRGLAFIDIDTVYADAGISTSVVGGFPVLNQAPQVSFANDGTGDVNVDRVATISLGNVVNNDVDNSTVETITVEYRAIVLNSFNNTRGQALNNSVGIVWDNPNGLGTLEVETSLPVTILEADIIVTKTFSPDTIDLDDEAIVGLEISHTGLSNTVAKDIVLEDILPAGLRFVTGSIGGTCPAAPTFVDDPSPATGGTISLSFDELPLGSSCLISFRVQHDPASNECEDVENCATLTWQSLQSTDQVGLASPPNNILGVERTGDASNPGEINNYNHESCDTINKNNGLAIDPFITFDTNPVCEGQSATISSTTNYNGSIVTYSWYGPTGFITSTSSFEIIIDPVTTGDAGDYFTIVDVDGCTSDTSNTLTLVVNSLPSPPTPTSDVAGGNYCEDDVIRLFASGSATATYEWTGPNGYTSNAQNPIILDANVSNNGTYQVAVTDANGCTSPLSAALAITVNTNPVAPIVTNDGPVCGDGTNNITLTASGVVVGGTVDWYDATATLVGSTNPLVLTNVTVADAGDYYAIVSSAAGCTSPASATSTVVVDVVPTDNADAGTNQTLCNGTDRISLAASGPSTGTGLWTAGAGNPAGATIVSPNLANSQVTGLTTGSYTFRWTLSNGACTDYSFDEVTIVVSTALVAPTANNDGPSTRRWHPQEHHCRTG